MDHVSSNSSKTSPAIRELNDSLYEFYKPKGWPSMVVLFFHGFQLGDDYENAHVTTWQSRDKSCLWPQTWLVDEFPGAHILTVSYHGCLRTRMEARKEDGKVDLYIIAENIMSDMRQAKIGQEAGCPIILVGHSFGGLVIKNLCWYAHTRSSIGRLEDANFLKNVKGIFFYSTPHHGIATRLAERFVNQRPLLEYVTTLSADAARMNEEFETLRNYYRTWNTAGLGEILQTKLNSREMDLIVEEASSRYGEDFETLQADHISICRPTSKTSKGFYKLTRLLEKFRNRFGAELPAGILLPYGESLVSEGGQYTFKNQGDGNLVVYNRQERAVWASGTWMTGRGAGYPITNPRGDLQLLTSGNLVLRNTEATGLPVWASMSQGNKARPHKLVLRDTGQLVVFDANLNPIWSSDHETDKTSGRFIEVDGQDELPSDVTWLQPYGKLVSHNKGYTFINQGDGNLCLYNPFGACTWNSSTQRSEGGGNLYMQRDGNRVLYDDTKGDGAQLWESRTGGKGTSPYKLAMQDDGNLVIYDADHRATWASNTR